MKTHLKYSLSDKDILGLTLYLNVPDIVRRFKDRGLYERHIYRVLERYRQGSPLQRRQKFLEDTISATKVSVNVSAKQKRIKVKKAIQLLGEDLCDHIDEHARLFEEKWN
jgi:hypothetical protein